MIKPDIPEDEEKRLKDLRSLNILDTPADERFDRLTRLAKRVFDVPIAIVSLVDEDRQWFKSFIGLSVRETPREDSFCGHAILGGDIFIVPDTLQDERFVDNPMVVYEPFIRFYAGCPITIPGGSKIGMLCIKDVIPRELSAEDIKLLKDMTVMVENEFAALQIATLDELTHINNRRGFLLLAQQSLDYCKRNDVAVSLVYFDLNSFKQINDNFGHAEGDKALTVFTDLVLKNTRDSDIFARFGGDEFVALLLKTDEKGSEVAISKLQKSLDHYNEKANRGYDIMFSYGVAEFDSAKHNKIEDLLAEGDALMYEFKKKLQK